jgi:hypothetical protein
MDYFAGPDGKFYISGEMPPGGRVATPSEVSAFYAANAVPSIVAELQVTLDAKAKERGYDDIKSACAYASPTPAVTEENPNFAGCEKFRIEGNALQAWMSLTWAMCYAYLATVQAGTNPMPTPEEAVAMMPEFTWPTE